MRRKVLRGFSINSPSSYLRRRGLLGGFFPYKKWGLTGLYPFIKCCLRCVLDKELPAWLFYTEDLYKLHLPDHSVPVLAAAASSCSLSSNVNSTVACNKSSYISKIVSHFISQRCQLVSLSSSNGLSCHAFVDFTEQTYGPAVAASLREPPFALASLVDRSCNASTLLWFNEPIDELVRRLWTLTIESLLNTGKIRTNRPLFQHDRERECLWLVPTKTLNLLEGGRKRFQEDEGFV